MIGMSVGKREILTTTNREDKIKVAGICPAKFSKGKLDVVVKIRKFGLKYLKHFE